MTNLREQIAAAVADNVGQPPSFVAGVVMQLLQEPAWRVHGIILCGDRWLSSGNQGPFYAAPTPQIVPERRIDDSDYSTGWNDCISMLQQIAAAPKPGDGNG